MCEKIPISKLDGKEIEMHPQNNPLFKKHVISLRAVFVSCKSRGNDFCYFGVEATSPSASSSRESSQRLPLDDRTFILSVRGNAPLWSCLEGQSAWPYCLKYFSVIENIFIRPCTRVINCLWSRTQLNLSF